jgi:hypothetical protein
MRAAHNGRAGLLWQGASEGALLGHDRRPLDCLWLQGQVHGVQARGRPQARPVEGGDRGAQAEEEGRVSGEGDRGMPELVAELIAELEALLERAADDGPTVANVVEPAGQRAPASLLAGATAAPLTPWQGYALELRDLCQRVLTEADEKTAVGFWLLLVEMAVRHGRRAGGQPA